jgi:phage terminase large subunit-like protein
MWCERDFWFFVRHCLSLGSLICNDKHNDHYGQAWFDHPWLFKRCREIQASPYGHLDLSPRYHFKGLALDTPVPTPDGWRCHGDLDVGDEVFAIDGSVTTVVGKSEVMEPECYLLEFDDGTDVIADEDHLWPIEKKTEQRGDPSKPRNGNEIVVMKTREIAEYHRTKTERRLRLPATGEAQYPERDLPIDPYVLGVWLGDGTSSSGGVTSADEEVWEFIREAGYELGDFLDPKKITRTVYGLRTQLRVLGVLNNKHVPEDYMQAGPEQRRAILQGLLDSDGTVHKDHGQMVFCSSDMCLAVSVQRLLASLGIKSHIREAENGYKGHIYVYFQGWPEDRLFRLTRKAERATSGAWKKQWRALTYVKPIGKHETSCIMVDHPSQCYLFGEFYAPTHNTSLITQSLTIWELIHNPELRIAIIHYKLDSTGERMLRQIAMEMEKNEKLKKYWPEIFWDNPRNDSPTWTQHAITVKRKGNPMEPSVCIFGLTAGQAVSSHFDIMKYDDIVLRDSVTNQTQIERTNKAWQESSALGADDTQKCYVGTRWAVNDSWDFIQRQNVVKTRHHDVFEDDNETPILFSKEWIASKQAEMGTYAFSAQMRNRPVAEGDQTFDLRWIDYYEEDAEKIASKCNVYIMVDTATTRGAKDTKDSDYTAIAVVGLMQGNPWGQYYLLDLYRDKIDLGTLTDLLFDLVHKWNPLRVIIEAFGAARDHEHLKLEQKARGFDFRVDVFKENVKKEIRIQRMQPKMQNRQWNFPKERMIRSSCGHPVDMMHELVDSELKHWNRSGTGARHDDMLDAISWVHSPSLEGIVSFPRKSKTSDTIDRFRPKPLYQRKGAGDAAWAV